MFTSPNFVIIIMLEVALLMMVLCLLLVIQNRSLRKLVGQLKNKAQELLKELKASKAEKTTSVEKSYLQHVEEQLKLTGKHHASLNSGQDIALDIAPDTPIEQRSAALRNALLLAEKDALSGNKSQPDWKRLNQRYLQIFNFYEEFSASNSGDELLEPANSEELEQLQTQLNNARQRANNLEKFKKLYFELEDKWNNTKLEAQSHFENLSSMASEMGAAPEFEHALSDYHASYNDMAKLIEGGIEGSAITHSPNTSADVSREIEKLRSVAADQHRIIEDLQQKLISAKTEDERSQVVNTLQSELARQSRFIQESETCIQLLEDELSAANAEVEQLRLRIGPMRTLKTELLETRSRHDEMEVKLQAALNQNRQLKTHLKQVGTNSKPAASSQELKQLHQELNDWESRYNDLEEKFLNLKLKE